LIKFVNKQFAIKFANEKNIFKENLTKLLIKNFKEFSEENLRKFADKKVLQN